MCLSFANSLGGHGSAESLAIEAVLCELSLSLPLEDLLKACLRYICVSVRARTRAHTFSSSLLLALLCLIFLD